MFFSFDEPFRKLSQSSSIRRVLNTWKNQFRLSCNKYPASSSDLRPEPPRIGEKTSTTTGNTPKQREILPTAIRNTPKQLENLPTANRNNLKQRENLPTANRNTLKQRENLPTAIGIRKKVGKNTPKGSGNTVYGSNGILSLIFLALLNELLIA